MVLDDLESGPPSGLPPRASISPSSGEDGRKSVDIEASTLELGRSRSTFGSFSALSSSSSIGSVESLPSPDANSSDANINKLLTEKFQSQVMNDTHFLEGLKASMHDSSKLQDFMEKAECHPIDAWHKVLLMFGNAKFSHKQGTIVHFLDEEVIAWFLNELLGKYPDVLQRMLLRGSHALEEQRNFGPLHAAIISNEPKIVELLTSFEYKEQIKQCLMDSTRGSKDSFKCIERALLWSQLNESTLKTTHSYSLAQFLSEFDLARKSDKLLHLLISKASKYPGEAWRTILLWASAAGETHIVQNFKKLWPESFAHIKYTSYQGGFSKILLKSSKDLKGKQDLIKLVGDIVDLVEEQTYQDLCARNLHSIIGDGWTGLHVACVLSKDAMVDVLMHSYDVIHQAVEASNYTVQNTFSIRPKKKSLKAKKEVTKELQPIAFDFSDDNWMNPMHYAVISGDVKIVKKFLNWKLFETYLNDGNLFMCTCFHMACRDQSGSHMLHALLENSTIDVNAEDCCSFGALHWAVYGQSSQAIKFILAKGKDPERPIKMNEDDAEGRQPLEIAMTNRSWKLLTSLPEVQQEMERFYRDRQVYADAANALLVGAALIAGSTFGGWLSPPIFSESHAQYLGVFWAFNSLSFFLSIASIMAGTIAVLPMEDIYIGNCVKFVREWLIVTAFLLIGSVVLVLGAFTAAGFAVGFANSHLGVNHLWPNMLATTFVGCLICFSAGVMFLRSLYTLSHEWVKLQFLMILGFLTKFLHCIQHGHWRPLMLNKYKLEHKMDEDWTVIGREWKAKKYEWKKHRGIHHFGRISTDSCRRRVLQYEKNACAKLQAECKQLNDLGCHLAQEKWQSKREW